MFIAVVGMGPANEHQENVLVEFVLEATSVTAARTLAEATIYEDIVCFDEGGEFQQARSSAAWGKGPRIVFERDNGAIVQPRRTVLKPQACISYPLMDKRQAALDELFTAIAGATA